MNFIFFWICHNNFILSQKKSKIKREILSKKYFYSLFPPSEYSIAGPFSLWSFPFRYHSFDPLEYSTAGRKQKNKDLFYNNIYACEVLKTKTPFSQQLVYKNNDHQKSASPC